MKRIEFATRTGSVAVRVEQLERGEQLAVTTTLNSGQRNALIRSVRELKLASHGARPAKLCRYYLSWEDRSMLTYPFCCSCFTQLVRLLNRN